MPRIIEYADCIEVENVIENEKINLQLRCACRDDEEFNKLMNYAQILQKHVGIDKKDSINFLKFLKIYGMKID